MDESLEGRGRLKDEARDSSGPSNTFGERTRDARFAFEELRMSRFANGARLLSGAVMAVLGWAGPGWATYGGGACHCRAPVAVVQPTTVVLAPQCQTVNQT